MKTKRGVHVIVQEKNGGWIYLFEVQDMKGEFKTWQDAELALLEAIKNRRNLRERTNA